MAYWQSSAVMTLLLLGLLLLGALLLLRVLPWLRRASVPASILAGLLGLSLGPDGAGILPLDRAVLEVIVYHGLAIVFIAVALASPARSRGKLSGAVRSFTFGIPFMQAMQAAIGLGTVLLVGLVIGETLHPGVGALLPMGFEEGPGQALSLGAAWEASGMQSGAQVGLIVAAIGYAWSIFCGIPLAVWGRRHGWVSRPEGTPELPGATQAGDLPSRLAEGAPRSGLFEPLTLQISLVAGCYALTWLVCKGLSLALASMPEIAEVIWGFHFMIGAGVAMLLRPLLSRLPGEGSIVDDALMGHISGITVDVMTCAALAAIQVAVFTAHWPIILLVTTLGGVATFAATLWLTSRAFPDAPFEHALLWFGMSTGTLPMGLALLRIVDPKLESPAPVTAVLGSAGAVVGSVPVLLFLLPMTVASWPDHYPAGGWIGFGAALAYALVLLVLWRIFAPLRLARPWGRIWHR